MNTSDSLFRRLSRQRHGVTFVLMLILFAFGGLAHAHSAVVYVDDDFSGSNADDPVSFVGNPAAECDAASAVYGADAFATITEALAQVPSGGMICVAPGTYAEADGAGNNLIIDKPVNIYGAQARADARNRTAAGASIIVPAVGVPNHGYDDSDGTIVEINSNSDGVVLDGVVLDGDNLIPCPDPSSLWFPPQAITSASSRVTFAACSCHFWRRRPACASAMRPLHPFLAITPTGFGRGFDDD